MLWGWGGDAECTIIHFFLCCYYVSLTQPCFAILGSSSWSFLPQWFYLACEICIHMFTSWQFSPLNSASVNIYCCDLIRSAECNACVFLAYAICEALTTLSSVFLCLFVAWARANYSIAGLSLNRSFDSLIVGLKMVSLWGPSGWRQDPCTILPWNVALLNQLRCCNCFHSVCTPFLLKVGCGVHLSSVSSCLLFVSVFVCYSSAGL
jgi:hypothetical protein